MKVTMKVKNLLFVTIFLAAASVGLAHPPSKSPSPPTNTTLKVPPPSNSPPAAPPTNGTSSPANLESILAASGAPSGVLGDLSKECQSTLLGIVTSPEFLKCIPVSSLLPLLPLVTDPSIIKNFIADPTKNYPPLEKPLLQFSTLFCPAPKCSDQGVAGAVKAISDGCKDDLDKKNPFIVMIFDTAVFYSPLHDSICFKFGKTFCWDESILTTISLPPSPIPVTGNKVLDAVAVADPTAVCTKCNKAIVNTFFNFIFDKANELARQILAGLGVDDKQLAAAKTFVAVKCGINFEDGKIPK